MPTAYSAAGVLGVHGVPVDRRDDRIAVGVFVDRSDDPVSSAI